MMPLGRRSGERPFLVDVPEGFDPPPGYWEFRIVCLGQADGGDGSDAGTLRVFVPGEKLHALPGMLPAIWPDIDTDSYERAVAQYELSQER